LDKPLAEQTDHAVSIPPLPAKSTIEFTNRPGSRRILLPTRGLSLPGLFLALFGMPFFGMGSVVLWMLITAHSVRGNIFVGWIIAPIFMLVGLFVILLAIAGMWGRQLIEENGAGITYSLLLVGRRIRPQQLLKREVEEVSLRPVPGRRSGNQQELIVRSDKRIVRISSSEISQQELEWLKVAVQCLITR
jgi:hypothetical protein